MSRTGAARWAARHADGPYRRHRDRHPYRVCLIGWALGINPLDLIEGQIGSGSSDTQQQSQPAPGREAQAPSDQMGQFVSAVLGSTEVPWKQIFAAAGKDL